MTSGIIKLLIVVPAIGPVYGGPSKSVVKTAAALARKGLSVDLVTTTANGSDRLRVETGRWIPTDGCRVMYFPYVSYRDYKFSCEFARWIDRNISNYELMQINAVFSSFNLPAYRAARKAKVPYIVTPRGMLEPWAMRHKGLKKKIYFELAERAPLNRAAGIHYLAVAERDGATPLNLKPCNFVIPNGVDLEIPLRADGVVHLFVDQYPELNNKRIILFMGRVDPKKGLDLLAPAFATIKNKYPDVRLVIAGPDNVGYASTVKDLFKQLGCADRVVFTGMLTGDLKQSALAAAAIFVAPSYSEGFSVSILEGMAQGLPCVFTTGCNFPEAGEARAAKVVGIDKESVASAIMECLDDPIEAANMGIRARKLVAERYTWDSIADQLIAEYQSILHRHQLK